MKRFEGKICVITGGALGIGRCLTRAFAGEGGKIAFLDLDQSAGEQNLAALQGLEGEHLFFCGDAAEKKTLEAFAQAVSQKYGRVDVLIHNACLSRGGILTPCSYEDFEYVQRVGVTAPYYLTSLLLPVLAPGASVVNISSTRALMSQANTESYTAAKGGISALTHALAVSLGGRVRVNGIAPGWIDVGTYHDEGYEPCYTPGDLAQHPSGRVGEPWDIARAALFLCDPENSFVNGEILTVDGGMTKKMIYTGDEGWTLETDGPAL